MAQNTRIGGVERIVEDIPVCRCVGRGDRLTELNHQIVDFKIVAGTKARRFPQRSAWSSRVHLYQKQTRIRLSFSSFDVEDALRESHGIQNGTPEVTNRLFAVLQPRPSLAFR